MSPGEFIDYAARQAVQPTAIPPQVRSVTSRAYYGAFHLAAQFIAKITGEQRRKHDAHVWLMSSRFADAFEAGRILATLNTNRIKADYRLNDNLAELLDFARVNVEYARDVQRLLLNCESASVADVLARR
jgi:uncharacterized protein (UPF0332 family)